MSNTLEEAQSVLWKDLVEAMKPELDAMQQDLLNKGQCFAKITNKGIQFIPCEAVYIKEDKPTKKVIDLSVLIDSQIDCEFKDDISERITIGKLQSVYDRYVSDEYPYKTGTSRVDGFGQCQPRMNHIHAWQDGECPIAGFVVRAWVDKEDFLTVHTSSNSIDWSKIMYVEFLEVEHGYVMPWESE